MAIILLQAIGNLKLFLTQSYNQDLNSWVKILTLQNIQIVYYKSKVKY